MTSSNRLLLYREMRSLVLVCVLLVVVSAVPLEQQAQFQAFKLKHNKAYADDAEEAARFAIFQQRLIEIEEHNALYEEGLTTYKKGINQFTDLSDDERQAYLRLHRKPLTSTENVTKYVKQGLSVADSVDWRTENLVSEVKSQGDCGSCWSFAVTGAVEGAHARKYGELLSLSEQQLMDCTTDINYGCDGGYLDLTFPYIQQYGLELETSYPYTAVQGSCQYDSSKAVAYVNGYVSLQNDEDALLEATYSHGPIAVAIDADYIYDYASGVFQDSRCTTDMNHGMLIVGYGTENNVPYWILKNSWGTDFGEQGYMKLIRGINACGITDDDTYPIIN